MRILVTGGCGFIGTNFVRFLLNATDHHFFNVDKLTYAANPLSLADVEGSDRYHFFNVDIANAAHLETALKKSDPDWIVHLAAESHVDRSISGPAEFMTTNITGTFNLLESSLDHYRSLTPARQKDFRFLHVSTDEVYGTLGLSGRFSETTAYAPRSPYSASKAASDHLARSWMSTYGLPVIVTHCANNFGPYQHPEKLIPLMISKCIAGQPLPVYGTGDNIRDWLFVDDHVNAIWTVLKSGQPGETYNIGDGAQRRNLDLVKSICHIMDHHAPRHDRRGHADFITFVEDRPGHDFRYAVDATKITQQLGWRPQHKFQSSLERTVKWYLQHPTWWKSMNASDAHPSS